MSKVPAEHVPLVRAIAQVLRDTKATLRAEAVSDLTLLPTDDPRKVELRLTRADGKVETRTVEMRGFPVHRGKWDEKRAYAFGDETAWAGCSWRAKRYTVAGEIPGQSDAWLLVAKQGKAAPTAKIEELERRVRALEESHAIPAA